MTVIVPVAPGGPSDLVARAWSEKLTTQFGKPFVVDNRPGASQVIGTQAVAKAEADGHVLLQAASSMSINAVTMEKLPYDTIKDFTPISLTHMTPLVVVVPAQGPIKSIADLVRLAKVDPGQISYGTTGDGSSQQLAMLLLAQRAGLEQLTEVRYKGSSQAHPDLISGRLSVMIDPVAAVAVHIKAGTLRALAVTTSSRISALPDTPTVGESGYPGYEVVSWGGVFAPASTPKRVVDQLQAGIATALNAPEMQARFEQWGVVAKPSSSEAFGLFVKAEIVKWRGVLKPQFSKQ
ncbi:tripartite tricarboxylate transporter substrate binding protein [Variovorax rhizosphaerae]|uniref:Tripartite tricarboxylate transporter substrate binding protein n=1 Tax=Variovorax rhizosphaerae TaxID=1836200 RepID=A0ABU8WK74_9BURK